MVRLQDEVIRKLTEIAKRNSVSYTEVKGIYSGLFEFLVSEFSQIDDSDPNTWNKNVIIKNFQSCSFVLFFSISISFSIISVIVL